MQSTVECLLFYWSLRIEGLSIKILITGASGFVGANLVSRLEHHELVLVLREKIQTANKVFIHDLSYSCDFSKALEGVDTVIHAAALVNHGDKRSTPTYEEYLAVNANSTEALARDAVTAGVKDFIFLSTVKVNGERTKKDLPFHRDSPLRPTDAYSQSKAEAERRLMKLAGEGDMRISIIRPPLIYGLGVGANFANLLKFSKIIKIFPNNGKLGKRSLVSIWNLCELIEVLIRRKPDSSGVYMVSDGSDCNTYELLGFMARAQHARMFGVFVPIWALKFGLMAIGKSEYFDKMFGFLQVDISHTKHAVGWSPGHNTAQGINALMNHADDRDS